MLGSALYHDKIAAPQGDFGLHDRKSALTTDQLEQNLPTIYIYKLQHGCFGKGMIPLSPNKVIQSYLKQLSGADFLKHFMVMFLEINLQSDLKAVFIPLLGKTAVTSHDSSRNWCPRNFMNSLPYIACCPVPVSKGPSE